MPVLFFLFLEIAIALCCPSICFRGEPLLLSDPLTTSLLSKFLLFLFCFQFPLLSFFFSFKHELVRLLRQVLCLSVGRQTVLHVVQVVQIPFAVSTFSFSFLYFFFFCVCWARVPCCDLTLFFFSSFSCRFCPTDLNLRSDFLLTYVRNGVGFGKHLRTPEP